MRPIFEIMTFFLFCICFALHAFGESGRKYKLDWYKSDEFLEYHSCGCADSCWVAELRLKESKKLKMRLRCDCEKLYITIGSNGSEKIYRDNCRDFQCDETNCKSERIVKELRDFSNK